MPKYAAEGKLYGNNLEIFFKPGFLGLIGESTFAVVSQINAHAISVTKHGKFGK